METLTVDVLQEMVDPPMYWPLWYSVVSLRRHRNDEHMKMFFKLKVLDSLD